MPGADLSLFLKKKCYPLTEMSKTICGCVDAEHNEEEDRVALFPLVAG